MGSSTQHHGRSPYPPPIVVAEIGCNHMGDMEIAKELISLAAQSGARYAKFQKRNPKELLSQDAYDKPHPVPYNSFGDSYGAHREYLELTADQHVVLKNHCDAVGVGYACSVWDLSSAHDIMALNPDYIKVPSACNTHEALLKLLVDKYSGQIHVSLGMTTKEEEERMMQLLKPAWERVVIYACTSGYPVAFSDTCLLEISRLATSYGDEVSSVGFSGHHLGIAIDVAAYALKATWIERHFTKDRTWKGTDHAASLEPGGLSKLVRNLEATHASLTYKEDEILDIEKPQRDKLKYK